MNNTKIVIKIEIKFYKKVQIPDWSRANLKINIKYKS